MRDKKLEDQINYLQKFIELWKEFHRLFLKTRSNQDITEQDEKDFFDIKTAIAKNYNILMESLDIEEDKDTKGIEILTQVVSLEDAKQLSEGIGKRITSTWNARYIDFQKILGELEYNRDELAKIKYSTVIFKKIFLNPISIIIYILISLFVAYRIFSIFKPTL